MAERKRRRKPSRWQRSFGGYGQRVTVWESGPCVYYARVSGCKTEFSLTARHGLRGREAAEAWARRRQADVQTGAAQVGAPTPTVERVFALYMQHHSPLRGPRGQEQDRQARDVWTAFLGRGFDLAQYWRGEHERFVRERMTGALNARGEAVPPKERRPVGKRSCGKDIEWLRCVIRWAMGWRENGRPLLVTNPLHGLEIPREANPRRPTATTTRYEKTRAVSDAATMQLRRHGAHVTVRSYLSEVLEVIHGTGRRIGAVLRLQYADLRLSPDLKACGIRWRADADKMGREWYAPIDAKVRDALQRIQRERPGVGTAWLFPSPANPQRPVSRRLVSRWLLDAEAEAGLPKLKGGLFHPYRRLWATSRKAMPVGDVAAAGGWKNTKCVQDIYTQPDLETLFRVVTEAAEVRELVGQA